MHNPKLKKAVLLAALLAAMIIAAGCGMSHEESLAQKDAWAEDVVRKSLIGLAQGHAIKEPASDAELLDDAFEYDDYIGGLEFLDERAGSVLCTNDYYLPKNCKVIIACPSYTTDVPMEVLYFDKEKYLESIGSTDEKDADKPLFTPINYVSYDDEVKEHLTGASIAEAVDDSVFADSIDKCDYLIVFDSIRSRVETNYYKNGMDRITIMTMVMVINVKHLEVEHIQVIKIDVPPVTYELGEYMGHFDVEGTVKYITALLTDFR